MNIRNTFIGLGLLLLFACNPMKKLETTQSSAQSAFESGNYSQALTLYEQLIQMYKSTDKEVPLDVLTNAGNAAYETSNFEVAKQYLQQAFGKNKTIDLLLKLIDVYQKLDDTLGLTKLIKDNIGLLVDNGKNDFAYSQLFNESYASGDYQTAYSDFKKIKNPDSALFDKYLNVLKELGKKDEASNACKEMLQKDPENVPALEWLAVEEYNKAESWYKSAMAKYNKDKNPTSYAYLRRDLKKISAIFRSAKNDFEKLHKLVPDNKQYIKYLKNCYLRLNMKTEAAAMDKLLK